MKISKKMLLAVTVLLNWLYSKAIYVFQQVYKPICVCVCVSVCVCVCVCGCVGGGVGGVIHVHHTI